MEKGKEEAYDPFAHLKSPDLREARKSTNSVFAHVAMMRAQETKSKSLYKRGGHKQYFGDLKHDNE